MNSITATVAFACTAAAVAAGYWAHPYVALVLLAIAIMLASSLSAARAWQGFTSRRTAMSPGVRAAPSSDAAPSGHEHSP